MLPAVWVYIVVAPAYTEAVHTVAAFTDQAYTDAVTIIRFMALSMAVTMRLV